MTYVIDKGRNGNGNHPRQWHGSILVRNMIEWPRCDMPPDILRRARAYDADRPHHPLLRTWEVMLDIDKRTIQGRVPEELWPVPNGNHNHADEGPSVGTKSGTSALDEIHTLFDKWLALSDSPARYDQIDIVLAVIVANRLPSDPLWLFLVAPPSSAKTETIQSLNMVPDTFNLSSLTANTFASGFVTDDDSEPSLLDKLKNKTLVMKDFGSILTMHHDKSGEIYGQLREIYDGAYSKSFGTGKDYTWRGKVGLLAGVTTLIDKAFALRTTLGERFLMYRIPEIESRRMGLTAIKQQTMNESKKRLLLQNEVARYLYRFSSPEMIDISESMADGLVALAEYVALGRAGVTYDSVGDIDYVAQPEGPGRLSKQLALLARALAIVRQEPTISRTTYTTIRQVAFDTIPATRQHLLALLLSLPDGVDLPTATHGTPYSMSMMRRRLDGLVAVNLAESRGRAGHATHWHASLKLRRLMEDVAHAATTAE